MEKRELLYEGKAKKVYATDDGGLLIVSYKDDATALNGLKRGSIAGKGVINNKMTNLLMARLEQQGIPTHFVKQLSDRDTLVKKVAIVPLEVIVRNISAGSFAKRYGVEEGIVFAAPTLEFSYKNDALGDPLLNDSHALALGLATEEEIAAIRRYALAVNELLKEFWLECGVTLVDFKLEFGRLPGGALGLLMQCGHFLHHGGADGADLSALNPQEQAELERLLTVLLTDWKNRKSAEMPEHHHGRHGK